MTLANAGACQRPAGPGRRPRSGKLDDQRRGAVGIFLAAPGAKRPKEAMALTPRSMTAKCAALRASGATGAPV
ncbi:hypothetical protein [Rhizobium yanglingense]